jgi:Ca2+-binding RTX toxin-like protein
VTTRSTPATATTRSTSLAAGNNHDLTFVDANVTLVAPDAGIVDGTALGSGNTLSADGSAETASPWVMLGGAGNDMLIGGTQNDTLTGTTEPIR